MSRRVADGLRWLTPLVVSGILMLLLAHTNRNGEVLGRYSRQYTRLLLTMFFLVAVAWWLAVDRARSDRLLHRVLRPGSILLLVGAFALLALIDILIDLRFVLSLIPLAVGLVMLWLASQRGARQTEAILASPRLRNLALAATALLFGLVLAEAAFRLVLVERLNPNSDRQFTRAVTRAWPHHVSIERQGVDLRILGLADSFGQAGGERNYHFVLEEMLRQAGAAVDVVNFSVAGYEPVDELTLLKGYGPRYQADLVLQGFFVGNDFNLPDQPLMISQGLEFRPEFTGLWSARPRNFWLLEWAPRFVTVVGDRWQQQREAASPAGGATDSPAPASRPAAAPEMAASGIVSEDAYLRIERGRLDLMRADRESSPRWQETLAILDQIRAFAARMGSDYVLVIHPDQIQVEDELFLQIVDFYGLNADDYDRTAPQRFLLAYCAENEIRCIDLLPTFREHGASGGLYLARDTHYNMAGNQLAAEQIMAELNQMQELAE